MRCAAGRLSSASCQAGRLVAGGNPETLIISLWHAGLQQGERAAISDALRTRQVLQRVLPQRALSARWQHPKRWVTPIATLHCASAQQLAVRCAQLSSVQHSLLQAVGCCQDSPLLIKPRPAEQLVVAVEDLIHSIGHLLQRMCEQALQQAAQRRGKLISRSLRR